MPVALAVPGYAVPVANETDKVSLDVLGMVRDEQGRPLGRFSETLQLPPGTGKTLAGKQVLYQSGVTLPPGRFSVKAVVRENATGLMGTYESRDHRARAEEGADEAQLHRHQHADGAGGQGQDRQPAGARRRAARAQPDARRRVAIRSCSSTTRCTTPRRQPARPPQLRTSLAFYRGKVKVYETPVVERTTIDAPERHAALFQFEVPPDAFTPGLYTCQINVIDTVAGHFAFPRVMLFVK